MTSLEQSSLERSVLVPSTTTWTRLEPQPRDATLARSLQAQVRDPLWLLCRQWQVGEFAGDDAGSPVQATLGMDSRTATGYRPGAPGGPVEPIGEAGALEIRVERGPVRFQVFGGVQLGLLFTDLAEDAGLPAAVIDAFRTTFAVSADDPAPDVAGPDGLRLRGLAAGRAVDGEALYRSVLAERAGQPAHPPLPAQAADPAVAAVLDQFVAQRSEAFGEGDDGAWQSADLQYAFGLEFSSTDAQSLALSADAFPGGHLDWYSFTSSAQACTSPPVAAVYSTTNMLPGHVTFHGMPSDRWWGFEDGKTDFGELDAQHVDLAKLLVMEFALVYGGDWFSIPVPSPIGSVQTVTTLVVTDTFGERTLIRPVEHDPVPGSPRPWSMFKVSDAHGALGDYLLLAPTLGQTEDAAVIEELLITRDPTAALAWAVEQTLTGADDLGIDGYEGYLARLRREGQVPPPEPAPNTPAIAYTLEHPPPDNWIPLVPVLPAPGRASVFRRGTMSIPGPGGTVEQLTARAELLEPEHAFYLTDRVVTPIGVNAQRMFRRTRLPDGSTSMWLAKRSGPGRGLGASGLKFDYLRDGSADSAKG